MAMIVAANIASTVPAPRIRVVFIAALLSKKHQTKGNSRGRQRRRSDSAKADSVLSVDVHPGFVGGMHWLFDGALW